MEVISNRSVRPLDFSCHSARPLVFHRVRLVLLHFPASRFRSPCMATKKALTISDVARMGARAQLKKYGKRQLRAWGKLGGRPRRKR
jgi:hypothetical protein